MSDAISRIQVVNVSVSRIVYRTDLGRADSLVIPLGVMAEVTTTSLRGLGLIARTELLPFEIDALARLVRPTISRPFECLKQDFDWAVEHTEGGHALAALAERHSESLLFERPTQEFVREVTEVIVPTRLLDILRGHRDHEFNLLLVESDKDIRSSPDLTAVDKLAA